MFRSDKILFRFSSDRHWIISCFDFFWFPSILHNFLMSLLHAKIDCENRLSSKLPQFKTDPQTVLKTVPVPVRPNSKLFHFKTVPIQNGTNSKSSQFLTVPIPTVGIQPVPIPTCPNSRPSQNLPL